MATLAARAITRIFVFNQFGDCEGAMLRPGNVHSAHNWREVLDPIVARYGRNGSAPVLQGRCRLRQAGGLRVPGGAAHPLRYQASQQLRCCNGRSPLC